MHIVQPAYYKYFNSYKILIKSIYSKCPHSYFIYTSISMSMIILEIQVATEIAINA